MSDIRLFGTVNDSTVDGTGIRFVVFVQGCDRGCKGCHNPKSQPFDGGYMTTTEEIIRQIENVKDRIHGVTLSGGEPFLQPLPLVEIADWCWKNNLAVWCFTGFKIEELLEGDKYELLKHLDILVDSPYVESERSLDLQFRGSKNQRIIKVKEWMEEHNGD